MKYKFRYYQDVRYVAPGNPAPETFARCGCCRRAWDDDKSTGLTPTPSGRCPFEYWHKPEPCQHRRQAEVACLVCRCDRCTRERIQRKRSRA